MSSGPGIQATRRYLRPPSPIDFPVEEKVPETSVHMRLRTALFLILERELRGRAFVGSDQFVYWDPTDPKACLAPDLLVRLGGPLELLRSFKVWLHGAPHLAIEVVSPIDARDKNLRAKLERYRRAAIGEVVIFDPDDAVEPVRLWDFFDGDLVERDRSDPAAFRCDALGAYWKITVDATLGPMLRVARDPEGTDLWLTPEEAEHAAQEAAHAAQKAAHAAQEAALARIAELEEKLKERG
jgi:Uma2 family endonuclease